MAKERGLTYVKLDGNVGILGNGAGLVMSTLDVVAQAGGRPANFLDAGGGSKAEAITSAVEVILSDDKVSAVLFNIFGGITRCDEVARGLIEAFEQIKPTCRSWSGSTARTTRRAARCSPRPTCRTCTPSRRCSAPPQKVVELGAADGDPRRQGHELCVSRHHRPRGHLPPLNNRDYGTQVVAGVTPGKGGQDVEGVPVFDTFHDAVAETGANTA